MFGINKTKIKHTLGFTLTELVVTTAIMGTLAAVAIPSYVETQAKSKAEKTMSNIAEMGSRVAQIYTELTGEYGAVSLVGTVNSSEDILKGNGILKEQGGATSLKYWSDVFPTGVPLSPFGGHEYKGKVISTGEVVYINTLGKVDVDVRSRASLQIFDLEDSTAFTMTFSF